MRVEFLHVLTVAPVLYIGIWLVARESLLGSDRLERLLYKNQRASNSVKANKESSALSFLGRLMRPRSIPLGPISPKSISPGQISPKSVPSRFMRPEAREFQSIKVDDLVFRLTITILVSTLIVLLALNYFRGPFFTLTSIMLFVALVQQRKLKEERRSWQKQLDDELPGLIQMLTLMISSGISPLRSIELLSKRTDSHLASELRLVIDSVKLGDSSSQALDAFARRVNTLESRRFSNAISMALERGSPLIPVLTALIGDARNEEKNRLLRRAGKSEIALMVPVVFLLLPISVLFALFPSFTRLQLF